MRRLESKVVLVTGGTAGIGREAAVVAAEEGARVVIAGRRQELGEEVVAQIQRGGGEAIFVATDVSQEEEVRALLEKALAKFGRIDGAFNNAGTPSSGGALTDQLGEEFTRVFDVNAKGVFLAMKHEIPAMLESGGGSIVNNASVSALVGFPRGALYVASKHAANRYRCNSNLVKGSFTKQSF
jgi:NAD(P)-dependent dehydrogenase (short-subunit alcohol dehydrogenase family)